MNKYSFKINFCYCYLCISSPHRTSKSGTSKRQTTLTDYRIPDKATSQRLNMAVLFFIVTCALPLSLVDKVGFIFLCNVLRPGFTPVGRKAITYTYLPKLYDSTKSVLKGLMKDIPWTALTSDTWTSKADEPYIALTAHFINNQWELIALTLCCRYVLS